MPLQVSDTPAVNEQVESEKSKVDPPSKIAVKTAPPISSTTGTQSVPSGSTASAPVGAKKETTAPHTFRSLQTVSLRPKQEEIIEKTDEEEEKILLNQPFTSEALQRSWNIYIDTIKNDTHLVNAMKSNPPLLKEDYQIEVTVQNQPLQKKFQDLTIPIERHLHQNLKNNRIKMSVRLAEVGEMTRPFTSRDKLEALIQKNPSMELLYRTFGLDIN